MSLETIRKILRDRDVTVLASAPLSQEEKKQVENADALICVNGSISSIPSSRIPDLWILNSREYDSPIYLNPQRWTETRKHLHETMMQQGAGRKVRHILFLLKNDSPSQTIARLKSSGVKWRAHTTLHAGQKTDLVRSAGVHKFDTAFNTSAGLTAICVALKCNPSSVTVCGFSVEGSRSNDYAYISSVPPLTRLHIAQDKEALSELTAQWGSKLTFLSPLFPVPDLSGLEPTISDH